MSNCQELIRINSGKDLLYPYGKGTLGQLLSSWPPRVIGFGIGGEDCIRMAPWIAKTGDYVAKLKRCSRLRAVAGLP